MATDQKVVYMVSVENYNLYRMAISNLAARPSVNFCRRKTDFDDFETPKRPELVAGHKSGQWVVNWSRYDQQIISSI